MVLKYPDLPENEIIAIIGFDFIEYYYVLHFEHNNGEKSWAKMNDAEKLVPKMVRDYIQQPGHKSIR